MGGFTNKLPVPGRRKRLFINVAGVRIAPDIINAYKKISNTTNPFGLKIFFANGRFMEIATTQEEQQKTIELLDSLKEPQNL